MKRLIVFIFLMIIATRYDYAIAEYVYDALATWTDIFYIYGELPSMALTSLTFALLMRISKRNALFYRCTSLGVGMWAGVQIAHHAGYSVVIFGLFALGVTLLVHWILATLSLDHLDKYNDSIRIIAWTGLLAWLSPQIIKFMWARPRPYLVFNGEQFQAWYIGLNLTFSNAYKSFPSGHSAVTASLMSLGVFKAEMKKNQYRVTILCISIYVLLMMSSRMIRGDHYLSDVVIGALLSALIYSYVLKRFMVDKKSSLNQVE